MSCRNFLSDNLFILRGKTMSAVQEFLTKVSEDQALQEELAKAMESENDRQAVTELAKSKGYEFTTEELSSAIEAAQAEIQAQMEGGELSEDELESVAGGATPTVVTTVAASKLIIASIGAASILGSASISKARW
jgi:predicted ribosomally synthesized peptide with nif11-like leader